MKAQITLGLVVFTLLFGAQTLSAQEHFIATKKGQKLEFATYRDGKIEGYAIQTVTDVKGSGDNFSVTISSEVLDADKKRLPMMPKPIEITQSVKRGNLEMPDMAQMMYAQMGSDVEVEGNLPIIPKSLKPGQSLPKSYMKISVDAGFMQVEMETETTDRKVEAYEDVTVPAGTFKAYKISEKQKISTMGTSVEVTNVSWYVWGIGAVKTDSFSSDGKPSTSLVLISK